MRQIRLVILFLTFAVSAKSQQNEGLVNYKTIIIDTINNVITPQDSMYMQFAFKSDKTMWTNGLVDKPESMTTILNGINFYMITVSGEEKSAYHGTFEAGSSFDELLNYKDTSLYILTTSVTKIISGRVCKKMILRFNIDAPNMVLWYDDTINCKSIIPGVGVNGRSIKGLILEYEMPSPNGKNIITADSISFSSVDDSIFTPNLVGYEITEMNPTNTPNGNN